MVSISGLNPSDDDKKITLKPRTSEVKTEPLPLISGTSPVDVSKDIKVKGLSVESSNLDARGVYRKQFLELREKINAKEARGEEVTPEEYALFEKYDILCEPDFNPSNKIFTLDEENAVVEQAKRKVETENPYWNEYQRVKTELINYEKTSPDRTSAKYKQLLNNWQRYEVLVATYEYNRGSSIVEYEKSHPVSGDITPTSRDVNISKNASVEAGNFSFNGGVNTNLSLNDIDRGEGDLSSTLSGGAAFNKGNLSVSANADVTLNGLSASSITPNYNLSSNASYNLKGFTISGNLSKNISTGSEMTTKEISLSRGISDFYLSATRTQNDMVFSEESSTQTKTGGNVTYNKGNLNLTGGYSYMETKAGEFNQLAHTVSVGGSFSHKNMSYNLNSDLLMTDGLKTPSVSGSVVYQKDKLSAGVNGFYAGGEMPQASFGTTLAYTKDNVVVKADVQAQKGQKFSGTVSVRATF